MKFEVIHVEEGLQIADIKREWNARRKGYIVSSRDGSTLLLGQCLPAIAAHINAHLTSSPYDRVSTTGLYDMKNKRGSRVGPYHKRIWKVESLPLEAVAARFEEARGAYRDACVVGMPECYDIKAA